MTHRPTRHKHYSFVAGDRNGHVGFGNKFQFEGYEEDFPIMVNKEILLGTNDYRDFYLTSFIKNRLEQSISTVMSALCVKGTERGVTEFIKATWMSNIMFSTGHGRLVINLGDAIVEVEVGSNTINFRTHSTFARAEEIEKLLLEHFDEVSVYVNWVYARDMSSITVPVDQTLLPVEEMYPFLNGESLDSYYQRFLQSRANILILIGPPGTGKTSFIRGELVASACSAFVTYDQNILSEDSLFAQFIQSDAGTLVIEDADLFLSSRADGNGMMHKFLNVGDGLVTVTGKKMIFSTNLPSINDIDEALLRPGRCFDVLHFGELTREEAETLIKRLGTSHTLDADKTSFTIAEIFAGVSTLEHNPTNRTFGFAPNK